ncbi:MAG: class I SAM-dependent methyltransferase [Acidimicrobiales bacterium]|nr:class I SAM-dependent methyltransferase [Acidimicrobiales bacterium]
MAATDTITGNTYDKYASQNPVERRLMAGFFRALEASLPTTPPGYVLEVGVGEAEVTSIVSDRYGDLTVAGIDLPDPALAAAWSGKPVAGSFADIVALPFSDDRFDLVLAIEVLEHVDDPDGALAEIARVATRDIVVSVPREPIWRVANMARGKYLSDLGNTPGHVQHWSAKRFTALVARHFEVVEVRTPFPWTMVQARVR